MGISHLVLQLLLALWASSSGHGRPVQMTLQHRLLSRVTGRHLAITKSGRVHANGDINTENPEKDATPLFIDRLQEPGHVRVASVKYASNSWYLVVTPEGRIRAQVPDGRNEILEEVHLPNGFIALRFVNYEEIVSSQEGSGSQSDDAGLLLPHTETGEETASTERRECYLGFSDQPGRSYGRAQCYSDTSSVHVRMNVIPHE